MNAAERILSRLPEFRRVRENEYRAKCPSHQGKSDGSLSVKKTPDAVLVHCFAGCQLEHILSALGMKSAAELFDSARTKPDPIVQRRSRALRGLEIWCEKRLIHVCEILRSVDFNIRLSAIALAAFEDGRKPRDPEEEEKLWGLLGWGYALRTDLEYELEILNGDDAQAKVNLWRQHR